jgi:hypothetical protein
MCKVESSQNHIQNQESVNVLVLRLVLRVKHRL